MLREVTGGVHGRASVLGLWVTSPLEVEYESSTEGSVINIYFSPHRYLIPNAGDATKAIKQQIMKVLDALES